MSERKALKTKSPKTEIILMTYADIDPVKKIEDACFQYGRLRRETIAGYVDARMAFVMRDAQDVVVGYILIRKQNNDIYLSKMAVHQDWRGVGLGRKVIEWLQKYAKDNNQKHILLDVRASNTDAIRLYKRAGFEEAGRGQYNYGATDEERTKIIMKMPSKRI